MKFKSIENKGGGKFIHRYDVRYTDDNGGERLYEMISRRPEINGFDQLRARRSDAVVMTVTSEDGEKLLLIHEYRMELGQRIYGFPGGLIEPGESPEAAAARELKEETGLDVVRFEAVLPPAACTVGIGDECSTWIFCTAKGDLHPDRTTGEDIEAGWYSKEEVRALHGTDLFGSWALAYSWMWANGKVK